MEDLILKHHAEVGSGNPAVYVGTYGKYNDGNLYGAWLDLTTFEDEEEFWNICTLLHKDEDDAEFMFQDWECIPCDEWIGESHIDLDSILEFVNKYSEDEQDIIKSYWEEIDSSADASQILEYYIGNYDSEEEFAEIEMEEFGYLNRDIPSILRSNIDWSGVWYELHMDGYENANGHFYDTNR